MKRKITADEHTALSDELKTHYWKEGDVYVLKIEGDDEVGELSRAHDRVKADLKKANDALKALQDAEKARTSASAEERDRLARESGDWAALEQSWKDKEAATKKEYEANLKTLQGHIQKLTVDAAAAAMATEISTAPKLIQDQIAKRLKVELGDDGPITRVLDANGKPSALSLDDLKKEFVDNPDYKGVIKDGQASGGGANKKVPDNPGGDAPLGPTGGKPENLAKLDGKQLAAAIKDKAQARIASKT